MNILKKSLAPITDESWDEIKDQANKIFNNYGSARSFVDFDGPKGFEYGAVSTGNLYIPENQSKNGINYGIHQVMPLIEIRKPFTLDIWELDNIDRGAKDPDFDDLIKAAKEVVMFEDNVVYNGFKDAGIKGLLNSSDNEAVKLAQSPEELLQIVASQIIVLKKRGVEGPYSLVINDVNWRQNMTTLSEGYPLIKQLEDILGGRIIVSPTIDESYLISERGGDYELVLGQDTSIGYDGHDSKKVKLYFTQSFTFRVLSPEAVVVLN